MYLCDLMVQVWQDDHLPYPVERLEITAPPYYFASSFRPTWALGLMTRQLGGPQQVGGGGPSLPSDSCVDVRSQSISLDCLYLLRPGGLSSLPNPAGVLNALENLCTGSIRCSYLCWGWGGAGRGAELFICLHWTPGRELPLGNQARDKRTLPKLWNRKKIIIEAALSVAFFAAVIYRELPVSSELCVLKDGVSSP